MIVHMLNHNLRFFDQNATLFFYAAFYEMLQIFNLQCNNSSGWDYFRYREYLAIKVPKMS